MIEILTFVLFLIFAIQIVFFALSASFKTDKFTDLSYGLTFVAAVLILFFTKSNQSLVQIITAFLITVWGLRLAGYLFVRILKTKKDTRFDKIRNDPVKFAKFWFLQAIAIFIILLPALIILNTQKTASLSFFLTGLVIWSAGFIVESIADQQKFVFKSKAENKDKWIPTGLWKYSRHPNYFGEILIWWGIFIIALPYLEGWLILSAVGPLFITCLLLFVTGIPTLEKKYEEKYKNDPDFAEYKLQTSLLVPLPPKI